MLKSAGMFDFGVVLATTTRFFDNFFFAADAPLACPRVGASMQAAVTATAINAELRGRFVFNGSLPLCPRQAWMPTIYPHPPTPNHAE